MVHAPPPRGAKLVEALGIETNRDGRRVRFGGEKARFDTRGRRVWCRVVHLSARLLVGSGRNRRRGCKASIRCTMWSSRVWRERWCWLRRRSGGTWSWQSRRSCRHGGSSCRGEAGVRFCPPPIVASGNGNGVGPSPRPCFDRQIALCGARRVTGRATRLACYCL